MRATSGSSGVGGMFRWPWSMPSATVTCTGTPREASCCGEQLPRAAEVVELRHHDPRRRVAGQVREARRLGRRDVGDAAEVGPEDREHDLREEAEHRRQRAQLGRDRVLDRRVREVQRRVGEQHAARAALPSVVRSAAAAARNAPALAPPIDAAPGRSRGPRRSRRARTTPPRRRRPGSGGGPSRSRAGSRRSPRRRGDGAPAPARRRAPPACRGRRW